MLGIPRLSPGGSIRFGGICAALEARVQSSLPGPPGDSGPMRSADRANLLATKLHVPRLRPGLVARHRLARQLDAGSGRALTLLAAPAGYGKSVALTAWAQGINYPVCWLSLDVHDDDPVRFWRHVLAALDVASPGIAERLSPLAGPPSPPEFSGLVTALVNELAAEAPATKVVLILDDYHLIASEGVHASIRFLLEHRPPGLRLIVASRADPPLGLAGLRASGELCELRVADLRFSHEEAAELLQQAAVASLATLDDAVVAALATRTEGWAAGLQLAALSLRDHPDVAKFVAAFTGSHRYVLDYLTEEVLERQSEEMRTFLLETSVLQRLCGPLCDAVTHRAGSQSLLEEADRSGMFLVPLDDVRGWWRYHHLFADLLRARLAQSPDRAKQLHRDAASWYRREGLIDDAIHHALEAGEALWAARLMEEHFDAVFNLRGEQATIQRWLPALPADVMSSRPRLLLAQAQMASMWGDLATAEPLLDAAEQAIDAGVEEEFEPSTGTAGSLLVNVPAMLALQRSYVAQLRGDADGTTAWTSKALANLRDGEWMLRSAAEGFQAVAEWLHGRLAEAETTFESSLGWWRTNGHVTTTAWGDYSVARLQCAQGDLDAAVRTCERAMASTAPPDERPLPAAGPALVGFASVAYERDDLDRAHEYVTRGITLCRQFVHTPPLSAGLATLAWIRQARGDHAAALDAMAEAASFSPGPPGLFNPVPVQQARLLLAHGERAQVTRWIEECDLRPDDEPSFPREAGYLLLARLLIATDSPDRALRLLDRLAAAARCQRRTRSMIEVHAVRAVALAAAGRDAEAIVDLAAALRLASPQRFVRVLADEGAPMARLLGLLIAGHRTERSAADVPLGFLARVQQAFDASPPASGPASSAQPRQLSGLIEPLTRRELQMLDMLATGNSNRDIAGELVVSLDTVKKHVSHVLAKLGASNRTEAVSRGRELGLIS